MDFSTSIITLFLVMDPIGNIPLLLVLLKNVEPGRRYQVLVRELVFALLILIVFLLLGNKVLTFFGFSREALSIAGAIVLFLIAIKMIFPVKKADEDVPESELFLVPIAVPLIAGPSALATILLIRNSFDGSFALLILAVGIAWASSAVIILLSSQLSKWLGKRFLLATEKLMGMLLVILAVQMFLDGIEQYLSAM